MSERQDELLKILFAEAEQELDGRAITEQIVATTRRRRWTLLAGGAAAAAAAVLAVWATLGVPLLQLAVLVSEALMTPLFDLGQGWLSLALLPLNTVGSVLAAGAKLAFALRKRILSASFGG